MRPQVFDAFERASGAAGTFPTFKLSGRFREGALDALRGAVSRAYLASSSLGDLLHSAGARPDWHGEHSGQRFVRLSVELRARLRDVVDILEVLPSEFDDDAIEILEELGAV